ncbi:expressed unknown protein [Seminavis robusta]|uniref:Uncharacterized protein n=1 Tax=Seminavis robusta TaxID=568900 RepID=A0A9N8DJG1_9STRA|nr:expressed unknown protein [Seminavis robusta]|eukprot:Sro120_g058330.1 n/a (1025) ;mRNA; r:18888-21962
MKSLSLPITTILVVAVLAVLWQVLLKFHVSEWQDSKDPRVAAVSATFQELLHDDDNKNNNDLTIANRGSFQWDMATFVWNRFAENFGSNWASPYMYNVLPFLGGLPSPMWRLRHHEAVVLIANEPPPVDYFSITTFCLFSWKRGLFFASLGDAINVLNIHDNQKHDDITHNNNNDNDLFAHVVVTQSSQHTLQQVQQALQKSGVPKHAIHVAIIPSELVDDDQFALFEVVMRLFRFHDKAQGEAYLQSNHPVFYIQGKPPPPESKSSLLLPKPTYKDRTHSSHVNEVALYANEFDQYQEAVVSRIQGAFGPPKTQMKVEPVPFSPLYIRGLHCLEQGGHCLGDCPDAAYFGSNIDPNKEDIPTLQLAHSNEMHVIAMVDHRKTNTSIYSNLALMKSPRKQIIQKSRMDIRGTPVGVMSNREFFPQDNNNNNNPQSPFLSWAFTRNPDHCTALKNLVDGCTVVSEQDVKLEAYVAYCERLYLNPITGTGPDWNKVLPARLYHVRNIPIEGVMEARRQENAALFAKLRLPSSTNVPLKLFSGEEPLRFLHIVKTGGEAIENYLWSRSDMVPKIHYRACFQSALRNITGTEAIAAAAKTFSCKSVATFISTLLCGLNCECCAADMHEEGRFHGTLLRSPRSHTLSLFTHGHNAHHTYLARIASDVPLYLAEGLLVYSETACGHSGTGGVKDWKQALEANLEASLSSWPLREQTSNVQTGPSGVQVISLRNTQSHALACSKTSRGSLGQHYRVVPPQPDGNDKHEQSSAAVDILEPDIEQALQSLHRMEWVGITDLFHPSLCLLHYQANQTLPQACDCNHKDHYTKNPATKPLPEAIWVEYRNKKRKKTDVPQHLWDMVDDHTSIDSQVYVAGLRLLLARLQRVEEQTGVSILACIDWITLKRNTEYIPGLWAGAESLLVPDEPEESHSTSGDEEGANAEELVETDEGRVNEIARDEAMETEGHEEVANQEKAGGEPPHADEVLDAGEHDIQGTESESNENQPTEAATGDQNEIGDDNKSAEPNEQEY